MIEYPTLSIIIPTFNEEETILPLLQDLQRQNLRNIEIIIADGGSSDKTIEVVEQFISLEKNAREVENQVETNKDFPLLKLIKSQKGRARQLNAGAKSSDSEFFLFLHADTRVPDHSALERAIACFMNQSENLGKRLAAHFSLEFLREKDTPSYFYYYLSEKTKLNRFQTTNGDQGLLIHRDFFEEIGGYDERFHFLEDQTIVDNIKDKGEIFTLPDSIQTSARRFEAQGQNRLYILMSMIMAFRAAQLNEFFEQAKSIYQSQDKAGKLQLLPFFLLFWSILRKHYGFWGGVKIWYRIGAFAKHHTWQLFFIPDVYLNYKFNIKGHFLTKFYDLCFIHFINLKLTSVISMIVIFSWYTFVLLPYFLIGELAKEN